MDFITDIKHGAVLGLSDYDHGNELVDHKESLARHVSFMLLPHADPIFYFCTTESSQTLEFVPGPGPGAFAHCYNGGAYCTCSASSSRSQAEP